MRIRKPSFSCLRRFLIGMSASSNSVQADPAIHSVHVASDVA